MPAPSHSCCLPLLSPPLRITIRSGFGCPQAPPRLATVFLVLLGWTCFDYRIVEKSLSIVLFTHSVYIGYAKTVHGVNISRFDRFCLCSRHTDRCTPRLNGVITTYMASDSIISKYATTHSVLHNSTKSLLHFLSLPSVTSQNSHIISSLYENSVYTTCRAHTT